MLLVQSEKGGHLSMSSNRDSLLKKQLSKVRIDTLRVYLKVVFQNHRKIESVSFSQKKGIEGSLEEGAGQKIWKKKIGLRGESNSGPLAPEARIIPLDHKAS